MSNAAMKTEIEVKLRIEDPAAIEARLLTIGASQVQPREFEDNQLYDYPDFALKTRGAMLRLRTKERGGILTYKESPRVEGGAKVRDELEVTVSDGEATATLITKIGLRPLFRYQKYRAVYLHSDLLITIDETPIGNFMELEGEKILIDQMAERLGYKASDYIVKSYLDLYQDHMRARSQPLKDMLFGR
jgi:adenylate cyclase class 2